MRKVASACWLVMRVCCGRRRREDRRAVFCEYKDLETGQGAPMPAHALERAGRAVAATDRPLSQGSAPASAGAACHFAPFQNSAAPSPASRAGTPTDRNAATLIMARPA